MYLFKLCIFLIFFTSVSLYSATFSMDKKSFEEIEKEYGKAASKRVKSLISLMNNIDKKSELEKLKIINDFFNKTNFKNDIEIWKVKDYWATRTEFLSVYDGDCEDYVIAKYFSLVQLGIKEEKLFLTYVKAVKYRQSHMVLSYYNDGENIPLILDNINPKILPASKRLDLRPIFNFNVEKIYLSKQRGLGRVIPQGKINLNRWRELILKIKRETK